MSALKNDTSRFPFYVRTCCACTHVRIGSVHKLVFTTIQVSVLAKKKLDTLPDIKYTHSGKMHKLGMEF